MIDAKQANELTRDWLDSINCEEIEELIKYGCNNGTFSTICHNVSESQSHKLGALGFKLMRLENNETLISWD